MVIAVVKTAAHLIWVNLRLRAAGPRTWGEGMHTGLHAAEAIKGVISGLLYNG